MNAISLSPLRKSLVCASLIAAVCVGTTLESEAGTRFSNRKSRYNQRGASNASARAEGLPAHGVAYRAPEPTAVPSAATTETPRPAEAKAERKGFFARLREKREQRQLAVRERNQAAQEANLAPQTLTAKIDRDILARASTSSTRVVVDISKQRAYLLVGSEVAVDTPVSTARPGKYTPRGTFHISQRVPSGKVSTIYGVEMPYWMRLDNSVFGLHAGYLPGYPASAGCIRLPSNVAPTIFEATQSGTSVSIYSSWNG